MVQLDLDETNLDVDADVDVYMDSTEEKQNTGRFGRTGLVCEKTAGHDQ